MSTQAARIESHGLTNPAQSAFSEAQRALAGANGTMKRTEYVLIGVGGLCIVGGLVSMVAVAASSGISMIVTGVALIGVAKRVLPRFAGMLGQATAMMDGFAAKERLAQTGVPAQGRLVHVQQTGRLVNYQPEISATVEVEHPQLGTYTAQTTAIVPQIAIPRAQPGAAVQVRVNPENPQDLALVF